MKRILAIVAALGLSLTAFADEGMWLLPLLQKMNGKALKEAGCKLSPEEIYSINHSSLKDARSSPATASSSRTTTAATAASRRSPPTSTTT